MVFKNEPGIARKGTGKNALHTLDVVDLARAILTLWEDAHRSIVTGRAQLLARWRPVDVEHGVNVIDVDLEGIVKLNFKVDFEYLNFKETYIAQVKTVEIIVLIRHREYHRLLRIPTDPIALHLKCHLFNWRRRPTIVQDNGPIGNCSC